MRIVPGTSLELEHQLQGCSCHCPAGNLLFRTRILLLIFGRQCLFVTAHLTATSGAQFKGAVALPR